MYFVSLCVFGKLIIGKFFKVKKFLFAIFCPID